MSSHAALSLLTCLRRCSDGGGIPEKGQCITNTFQDILNEGFGAVCTLEADGKAFQGIVLDLARSHLAN